MRQRIMTFLPRLQRLACTRCSGTGKLEGRKIPAHCQPCGGTGSVRTFNRGCLFISVYILFANVGATLFLAIFEHFSPPTSLLERFTNAGIGFALIILPVEFVLYLLYQKSCHDEFASWEPGVKPFRRDAVPKENGISGESWRITTSIVPSTFPRLCPCCAAIQIRPEQSMLNLAEGDLLEYRTAGRYEYKVEDTTLYSSGRKDVTVRTVYGYASGTHRPIDLTKAFPFCSACKNHVRLGQMSRPIKAGLVGIGFATSIFLIISALFSARTTVKGVLGLLAVAGMLICFNWIRGRWALKAMLPECTHVDQPLLFEGEPLKTNVPPRLREICCSNKHWAEELLRLNPGLEMEQVNGPLPRVKNRPGKWILCAGVIAAGLAYRVFVGQ